MNNIINNVKDAYNNVPAGAQIGVGDKEGTYFTATPGPEEATKYLMISANEKLHVYLTNGDHYTTDATCKLIKKIAKDVIANAAKDHSGVDFRRDVSREEHLTEQFKKRVDNKMPCVVALAEYFTRHIDDEITRKLTIRHVAEHVIYDLQKGE